MNWYTEKLNDDSYLIDSGEVVVGSINKVGDRWFVEVLWSGPSGDIKGDFSDYRLALAFVEGVEKGMMAES